MLRNYALVWALIIGSHFAVLYGYYGLNLFHALSDSLVFNVFFAFIGLSLWYVVRFNNHESSPFYRILLSNILAALFLIGFWIITGNALLRVIIDDEIYLEFSKESLPWRIVSGLFYYAIFTLMYYIIVFQQNLTEKVREEEKLKTTIKEVELNALKAQINPHFLFNSLNSINALTIANPEKARQMTVKLSDYLRYTINNKKEHITRLKEELENAKRYLEIEKIRFGDKLIYTMDIESGCEELRIPSLILQPLLENAIKHGVQPSIEGVEINLKIVSIQDHLQLELRNGFDKEGKSMKGTGTGIRNISERLTLLYKRNDLMKIEKMETHFVVNLNIPQEG